MTNIRIFFIISVFIFCSKGFSQEVKFQGKLSGIKSSKGIWLTQPVYKSIQAIRAYEEGGYKTKGFIATKANGDVLIGADGKTLASPVFESINIMNQSENLFVVKKSGKYSFFRLGEGILKLFGEFEEYHTVSYFPDYLVLKKNGKLVMADLKRKKITNKQYEKISDEVVPNDSSELIIAKATHWGISDMDGKEFLPFIYDSLKFFYNLDGSPYVVLHKNGKSGLSRADGRIVAECKFEGVNETFFRMIPEETSSTLIPVKQNGKWGCIDSSGKWTISADYDELKAVLAHHQISAKKGGKMGILDFKGKQIYPFTYEFIQRIDAGRLIESKEKNYFVSNGRYSGITDSSGKPLVPLDGILMPLYSKHYFAGENEAKFDGYDDSLLVGYIRNVGGKIKKYLSYSDSVEQMAIDEMGNETIVKGVVRDSNTCIVGGKNGVVDEFGKTIVPVQYDDMQLAFVNTRNEDRGIILLPVSSEKAPPRNLFQFYIDTASFIPVKLNAKWGLTNFKKSYVVIPCEYDSLYFDYTSSGYDASDSMYALKGFPKKFIRVYQKNLYGYVASNGKSLVSPQIEDEMKSIRVFPYDSVMRPGFEFYQDHQIFCSVVTLGGTRKNYSGYKTVTEWGMDGMEFMKAIQLDLHVLENPKFNILNTGKVKIEGPWSEDLLLINHQFNPCRLNSFVGQFPFKYFAEYDSVFDAQSKKKVFPKYRPDEYYVNYYFSRENGKWYLRDMARPEKGAIGGFDSIEIVSNQTYKAWTNKKFAFYHYKYEGPFDRAADLEYPSGENRMKFLCRDCDYTVKKYLRENKYMQYDSLGNQRGDTVEYYYVNVPVIKKGSVNITEKNGDMLLSPWADEMILPKDSEGHYFSMNDSSSAVFKPENFNDENYPFYGTLKKSVGLRYGDKWRLQSLNDPKVFVEGLKEAKLEGDKWAVIRKKKKVIYYSVQDLKEIKQ